MNMICNPVPTTLNIAGAEYRINTDFRVWIVFEQTLTGVIDDFDKTLSDILKKIFIDIPPNGVDETATEAILNFYRCGKDEVKHSGAGTQKEIFNYDYDDGYIFSAFLQQYDIDLNSIKYLHWWKFRALFQSLSDDTEFVKIMGYRSVEINSKMSAEQRNFYQKMKKMYALPLPKDVQEKCNAIEDALIQGKSIDELL